MREEDEEDPRPAYSCPSHLAAAVRLARRRAGWLAWSLLLAALGLGLVHAWVSLFLAAVGAGARPPADLEYLTRAAEPRIRAKVLSYLARNRRATPSPELEECVELECLEALSKGFRATTDRMCGSPGCKREGETGSGRVYEISGVDCLGKFANDHSES